VVQRGERSSVAADRSTRARDLWFPCAGIGHPTRDGHVADDLVERVIERRVDAVDDEATEFEGFPSYLRSASAFESEAAAVIRALRSAIAHDSASENLLSPSSCLLWWAQSLFPLVSHGRSLITFAVAHMH
jgi:hypothetical protein